jgi:hypothetical protein
MGMKAIELNYLGISKPSNVIESCKRYFHRNFEFVQLKFSITKWWMFKPKIEIHERVSTWCSFEGKMKSNACLLQCANVHVGDFVNVLKNN